MSESKGFSSRWAMMLAMLSMAVGTGNIWRFPRIAATNGGGEFLVAWVICLFTWSIPLILIEFGMGRKTRLGPIGAFVRTIGQKYAWMGAFIGALIRPVGGWIADKLGGALVTQIITVVMVADSMRTGTIWPTRRGVAGKRTLR